MDDQFSLTAENLNEALRQLRDRLEGLWEEGLYTRVRLKLRGQSASVELPIAAFVAGELGALALFGPLRAILTHLSLGSVVDVELVRAPSDRVLEARGHLARRELDAAEAALREALARRPSDPAALLSLGLLLRDTERLDEAVPLLTRAAASSHPDGVRAAEELAKLRAEGWIPAGG